jgi:hemerythrin
MFVMALLAHATAEPPILADWTLSRQRFAITEFTVGDKLIDDQHDHIFRVLNALQSADSSGDGARTADALLDHLHSYLTRHFAREERFMEERGYPKARSHTRQHRECLQRLTQFVTLVNANVMHAADCAPFAREWLNTHLLGSDRQFARWLQGRRAITDARSCAAQKSS